MNKISIIMASSECAPFAKSGGMADVISSLANELKKSQVDIKIFLPFYKQIKNNKNYKIKELKGRSTIKNRFNLSRSILFKNLLAAYKNTSIFSRK